ncbi:hypothetical protein Vi05172_g1459 [Venturia inaequalis]|nr:hypothetical protein Vi05172_g1459 [Venturia inaequalis]
MSDKTTLLAKTTHLQTLLTHFKTSLTTTTTPPPSLPATTSPNPLPLLRDASHLLKAQTTKLGLLLLNEPFTPSAVIKVLSACEAQPLPAIMGALELCHSDIWGVEGFRGMIVDAIGELKEWGEDEEDLDEGFGGSEGDAGEEDRDDFEDMFSAANKLPSHRRDLRDLLDETLRVLRLVDMLYKAVAKRRIKTFPVKTPPLEDEAAKVQVKTLNEVVTLLKSIPESVDDLANAFYELDAEDATSILTKITTDAKAAATAVEKSWTNTPDEFTTWRSKFEGALSKKAGKEEKKTKQTMKLPFRSN